MNTTRGWTLLVLLLFSGCAPQPVAYQGTATLDGQPIESGRIHFVVKGEPPHTAEIVGGHFSGLALPGSRRVEIYAFRPGVADPGSLFPLPGEQDPLENFVPDRYNVDSTLSAEITPSGPNVFEFTLVSASP